MIEFKDKCPRCGAHLTFNVDCAIDDDAIVTEAFGTWNEAAHTFNPPHVNEDGDIACPVCQAPIYVSGKIDLALVAQSIYVPRTLNTWLEEEQARSNAEKWFSAVFFMNEMTLSFFGYTRHEHWNGWCCPRFEKASADAIMKHVDNDVDGVRAWYDEENDTYLFWDVDNQEEPEAFCGTKAYVDGRETILYDIGRWHWVWEMYPRKFEHCNTHAVYFDDNREPDRYTLAIAKWSRTEGPGSEEYLKDDKHPDLEGQMFIAEMQEDRHGQE